jgi:hypothetical protein
MMPAPLSVVVHLQTLEAQPDPTRPLEARARLCTRMLGQLEVPAGSILQRLTLHVQGDPAPILSIPLALAEVWPDYEDDDDIADELDRGGRGRDYFLTCFQRWFNGRSA